MQSLQDILGIRKETVSCSKTCILKSQIRRSCPLDCIREEAFRGIRYKDHVLISAGAEDLSVLKDIRQYMCSVLQKLVAGAMSVLIVGAL